MIWNINIHSAFDDELLEMTKEVRIGIASEIKMLKEFGAQLGRPHVDTLKGSKHKNMKELRFKASDGEWRVAFAFDPKRQAVLLVAGDKSGVNEKRFYKQLIKKADARFDNWLSDLKGE